MGKEIESEPTWQFCGPFDIATIRKIHYRTAMKTIADFGALVLLVAAFGLLGACIEQSEPTSETHSELTAASPACATVEPASASTMLPEAKISSPQPNTFPPLCGICSDFSCQTRSVGAVCDLGTGATCVDNIRVCRQDGLALCRCGAAP
jgi:hypothetical protein